MNQSCGIWFVLFYWKKDSRTFGLPAASGTPLMLPMYFILNWFLTARGEDGDKFRGFGLGADDYMVKPFLPKELVFRIAAILRRTYKDENPLVTLKHCEIDFERAEVLRRKECEAKPGRRIPLTAKEYEILLALYRNAGRIVTIDTLCEAAWGDNPYGYENSLMAHIRRIREKIEAAPSKPESLITVKGLGYKLIVQLEK